MRKKRLYDDDGTPLVICDECGITTPADFKERKFSRGLIETYIECGACYAKTTSFITNAKVRKLQKESATVRDKPHKTEVDIALLTRNFDNIEKTIDELVEKHGR